MSEFVRFVLVAIAVLVFALLSNVVFARTRNFVYSRKSMHALAGLVILSLPVYFTDILWPLLLSLGALIAFIITHRSEVFFGFQKTGRLSEVWFAFSVLVCIALTWQTYPWLGIAACLFMAWGDGITGLVRWWVSKKHEKGLAGSAANLVMCSAIGVALVNPYPVGLIGAAVFTIAEHLCGDVGVIKWVDDNVGAPLTAVVVMLAIRPLF